MTRGERFATGLVRTTVIALLATVVAVVVAIALSPLWPIGLARVAEPSPGLAIIGNGGTVVIQDVTINNTATYFMAPVYAWIFAAIAIVAYA